MRGQKPQNAVKSAISGRGGGRWQAAAVGCYMARVAFGVMIRWLLIESCDRMLPLATRGFNAVALSRNLRSSARTAMKVVPVPVRSDNYAYLLIDEESKNAAAVDPYDLPKVTSSAQELGVKIVACITTHHHDDHSGGNHVCEFG